MVSLPNMSGFPMDTLGGGTPFSREIDIAEENDTITLKCFPAGDILLYVNSHPSNKFRGKPTPVKCGLVYYDDAATCSFRC